MTVMEAWWNGVRIARSDDTVVVEGNHYFPRECVDAVLIADSETTSHCPWKGTARYHHVRAGGAENRDAVWYYPDPSAKAAAIRDRVAFWRGVEVRAVG